MTQPGQLFTVTSAAVACGVSRKTITRRLDQLRDGGAYKDAAGAWVIPLAALYAAGMSPGRPAAPDPVPVAPVHDVGRRDAGPTPEILAELAELRRRAEVAEALATERAEQIADLRRAFAMLEAAKPSASSPAPAPQQSAPPAAPVQAAAQRRGLLGRALGNLAARGW